MSSKIAGLLGLSRKAGLVSCGVDEACRAARSGVGRLMLVAADAAKNSAKKAADCAAYHDVPIIELPIAKAEMGRALGLAEVSVVSVNDKGLAQSILRACEDNNGGGLK